MTESQQSELDGVSLTRCHKCGGIILPEDLSVYKDFNRHLYANFHKKCFNGYEHYYGLDQPID